MKIFFQGQLLSVGIPVPSGSYVLKIEETDIFRCIHRKIPSSHNHGDIGILFPSTSYAAKFA